MQHNNENVFLGVARGIPNLAFCGLPCKALIVSSPPLGMASSSLIILSENEIKQ